MSRLTVSTSLLDTVRATLTTGFIALTSLGNQKMTMRHLLGISFATMVGLSGSIFASTFTGLGDLEGGEFASRAFGISDDGMVVVGSSVSDIGMEAFRWSKEEGIVGLGFLPSGDQSRSFGVADFVQTRTNHMQTQQTRGSPRNRGPPIRDTS